MNAKTKAVVVCFFTLISMVVMKFYYKKTKPKTDQRVRRIEVSGTTSNIDGRAAVIPDGQKDYYFIWGMGEWEKDWEHHRVKVIGDLSVSVKQDISFIKDAVVQMVDE